MKLMAENPEVLLGDTTNELIALLSSRERQVVERCYGFIGQPQKMSAVARELSISPSRVRQLRDAALRKLNRRIQFLDRING
jgi:DNA-directed RNA polymerase sigma subunit (sigma70/sigma32)